MYCDTINEGAQSYMHTTVYISSYVRDYHGNI